MQKYNPDSRHVHATEQSTLRADGLHNSFKPALGKRNASNSQKSNNDDLIMVSSGNFGNVISLNSKKKKVSPEKVTQESKDKATAEINQ